MTSWRGSGLLTDSPVPPVLFVDDGGVLNDNGLRGPEWLRLIGEFMPPRLGGTAEQWSSANRAAFPEVWERFQKSLRLLESYEAFLRAYDLDWITTMCAHAGIALPPEDEALSLVRELAVYVAERAECAMAGAAEAVLALRRAGYELYTASGTASWELRGIVTRMGLDGAFSRLYGPDLVDRVKHGPAFYERVFAHAGVEPARALVLESDAECCRWAREAGARAVWIDADGRGDARSLAHLVQALI